MRAERCVEGEGKPWWLLLAEQSRLDKLGNSFFLQSDYQPQRQHALGKHAQAESPAVRKNRVTNSQRRELNLWQVKTKAKSLCGIEITLLLP